MLRNFLTTGCQGSGAVQARRWHRRACTAQSWQWAPAFALQALQCIFNGWIQRAGGVALLSLLHAQFALSDQVQTALQVAHCLKKQRSMSTKRLLLPHNVSFR